MSVREAKEVQALSQRKGSVPPTFRMTLDVDLKNDEDYAPAFRKKMSLP